MDIRQATTADAAGICAIYNEHVKHTIVSFETEAVSVGEMATRMGETLRYHDWLVGIHDQEIIGYAYYGTFRARAAYRHTVESTIYFTEAAQGQGMGRQLYHALTRSAKAKGYQEMVGVIALPNPASLALHQKLGFTEVGVLKNIGRKFDTYIDVALWQLSLAAAQ